MKRPVRTGVPPRVTSLTSTTPRRRDLDPPPGAGRLDIERLRPLAGVHHGLDSIALHPISLC